MRLTPIGRSPTSFSAVPAAPNGTGRKSDTRPLSTRTGERSPGECVQLPALDDLVDDPVRLRLVGGEDLVALDVQTDLVDRLAGVPREDLLHLRAHPLDLGGVDLEV